MPYDSDLSIAADASCPARVREGRTSGSGTPDGTISSESHQFGKILLLAAEDWFVLSHFRPLLQNCLHVAREVVVACRDTGRANEVRELGVRVIGLDCRRGDMSLIGALSAAWRLRQLINSETPDVIHAIALKPILLAMLAGTGSSVTTVAHVTGMGYVTFSRSMKIKLLRRFLFRLLARAMSRRNTWLIVENHDDLALLERNGARLKNEATVVGGAGVDERHFAALASPANPAAVVAFAGRLIRSKGLETLIAAKVRLNERGVKTVLDIYGPRDADNPESISLDTIEAWTNVADVAWHGPVCDVREIWRRADICVVPSLAGEGMPRAMLEAAACGRPLIVTATNGCRHFVRDGVEGRVVPPGNAAALADAIAELADRPELRVRMGNASRERLLSGYTERHVTAAYLKLYAHIAETIGARAKRAAKPRASASQILKRGIDITVSTAGLIATAPVLLVLGILIRLESPGPALFAQTRVGYQGRGFRCYKLRTMRTGVGDHPTHHVSRSAVTRLGHVLRRTKLDELPQLWNVLRGDMTLVGPRPCLPSQTQLLNERRRRGVLNVRPGITGLAQLRGVDMSAPRHLARLDALYTNGWSVAGDIRIMLATLLGGSRASPSDRAPSGRAVLPHHAS